MRPILPNGRVAATLALLLGLVLTATGVADRVLGAAPVTLAGSSSETLQRNLTQAAAVFATARALNAAISVAQSVEVSAGVGVQGAAQPFQVLDPINQLVEQFSSVMLGATVAIGGTLLLVEIGDRFGLLALLPAGLALLAVALWLPGLAGTALRRCGHVLLVVAVIAKLGLPAAVLLSDAMADAVVEPRIEAAGGRLNAIDVPGLPTASAEDPGWLGSLRQMQDITGQVTRAVAAAGTLADDVVDLTVAFAVKIIVVPIAMLWLLTHLAQVLVAALVTPRPKG